MKFTIPLLMALAAMSLPFISSEQPQTESSASTKPADLCVQPARGPITGPGETANSASPTSTPQPMNIARVGHAAPDFEANAYVNGGFKPIKLSDHRGKWVVLCFYPGDFTFV